MKQEVQVTINEAMFNSILLGDKTCIHSFSSDEIEVGDEIELIEIINKRKTGRKLFVEVTYIDHLQEPFNLYLYSIEVIGASNI